MPIRFARTHRPLGRAILVASAFLMLPALVGCSGTRKDVLVQPATLRAPQYPGMAGRTPVWAVAPLRNESGVSVVDSLTVTDQLARQVHSVEGLDVIPVNRTIAAMRALRMEDIYSPADARRLAEALGADAIIVGTMTAWDPYDPPKIGLSLALFAQDGSPMLRAARAPLATPASDTPETFALETSGRDMTIGGSEFSDEPIATASEHLDGANHGVQMLVKNYASGRHETVSALGWRRYLASMPLYTDFASYRLVGRLLEAEQRRVGGPIAQAEEKN